MTEPDIRRTTKKFFKINGVETEKMEFHCSKKMINKNNVDVQEKLVSDEFAFEKNKAANAKYFKGYKKGL